MFYELGDIESVKKFFEEKYEEVGGYAFPFVYVDGDREYTSTGMSVLQYVALEFSKTFLESKGKTIDYTHYEAISDGFKAAKTFIEESNKYE